MVRGKVASVSTMSVDSQMKALCLTVSLTRLSFSKGHHNVVHNLPAAMAVQVDLSAAAEHGESNRISGDTAERHHDCCVLVTPATITERNNYHDREST